MGSSAFRGGFKRGFLLAHVWLDLPFTVLLVAMGHWAIAILTVLTWLVALFIVLEAMYGSRSP